MGGNRQPHGLRLGEHGIGGDDGDGRVLDAGGSCGELRARQAGIFRKRRGQAEPAELGAFLEGRGPEMPRLADRRRAERVDGDEGADGKAFLRDGGGRAEAALERGGEGAGAGSRAAGFKGCRSSGERRMAELAIGRVAAPVLLAAIHQVEEDGGRDDGHAIGTDGKASARLAQARLHAGGRIEPEGRAAGEHDGIDRLHGVVRGEKVRLARARRAAEHLNGRHRRFLAEDHRDAGAQGMILGIADAKAGDIRDEVFRPRPHSARSSAGTNAPARQTSRR